MDYIKYVFFGLVGAWVVYRLIVGVKRITDPVLGVYNLGGRDQDALAQCDLSALGDLFKDVRVRSDCVPKCDVLLVYGAMDALGRFEGAHRSLGDVVDASGASIVVLATEHDGELLAAATRQQPIRQANLVLAIERKGDAFSAFLRSLFDKMMSGKSMPSAWVQIAPQGPTADHDALPSSLFLTGPAVSLRRPTSPRSWRAARKPTGEGSPSRRGSQLRGKDIGQASAQMSRGLRIARWTGFATLVLLAGRGLLAISFDVLNAGIDDLILHPKTSGGWTAFERYISYNWIADVDRYVYLARSTKDRSCGFRKLWPADSGNSGTLLEGLSAVVLGVLEVARPVGRAA
jgi:hypothetical protein